MLFHMVALVLLSMVAFLTIFLLAENLQQPIRVFEIGGYWSCHGEQNAGSLLTPISDTVFYALSHGTHGLAFHGSSNNHLFQTI